MKFQTVMIGYDHAFLLSNKMPFFGGGGGGGLLLEHIILIKARYNSLAVRLSLVSLIS